MFSASQALARLRNSSRDSAITGSVEFVRASSPMASLPRLCRSSVELVLGDCTAPLRGCTGRRLGVVQVHRGTNECLQRLFVDLVALMEVDGAPGVAVEAGVEETRGIIQRGALGESPLHDFFVCLAGADHPVVIPNWDSSPLPLLDHGGVGLPDQFSDASEHLTAPITELRDPGVDQPRRRVPLFFLL